MHYEVLNFVISVTLCRSMTRAEGTVEVHGLQISSVAANVLMNRYGRPKWVGSPARLVDA
jgi:hypothetical protein